MRSPNNDNTLSYYLTAPMVNGEVSLGNNTPLTPGSSHMNGEYITHIILYIHVHVHVIIPYM